MITILMVATIVTIDVVIIIAETVVTADTAVIKITVATVTKIVVTVTDTDSGTRSINSTTIVLQDLPSPTRVNGSDQLISVVLTITGIGPLAPSMNMGAIADPR